MKAWGGRFSGATEPLMEKFSSSIQVDWRLFSQDIEGSIAYAEMLERIGIFTTEETGRVSAALREIALEIEQRKLPFRDDLEDIHMHVEHRLIEKVGDLGKKLHTGRSRNEQVSLDTRMYVKDALSGIDGLLKDLLASIIEKAEAEGSAIMPGYTHTRRAQVVPFAHYLLSYYYMLKRDRKRAGQARDAADAMPLGSGALAGSTLPIDREFLRQRLGFARITENSMDAASERDFVLDALHSLSMIMLHLSKLCEDLILFSTEEYAFIELPDGLCTGSSLMPHKKNPDALELVRGKTSRCIGSLFTLYSLTKGLPSTYNRDLQEDKEPLFQTVATVEDALQIMRAAILGLTLRKENMERAVMTSHMPAVEMTEYLAAKGVPFREAHHVVGTMVKVCEEKKKYLWEMEIEEMKAFSGVFDSSIYEYINPRNVVENRKTAGSAALGEVGKQIETEKAYLGR
jgi:argininosuccinate lyase